MYVERGIDISGSLAFRVCFQCPKNIFTLISYRTSCPKLGLHARIDIATELPQAWRFTTKLLELSMGMRLSILFIII